MRRTKIKNAEELKRLTLSEAKKAVIIILKCIIKSAPGFDGRVHSDNLKSY